VKYGEERNKKRKEEGRLKSISELSVREQRHVRKAWRNRQKRHRVMVKRLETFLQGFHTT